MLWWREGSDKNNVDFGKKSTFVWKKYSISHSCTSMHPMASHYESFKLVVDVGVQCQHLPYDSASFSHATCLECINMDTQGHTFVFGCTFGPGINANKDSNTVMGAASTSLNSRRYASAASLTHLWVCCWTKSC